MYKRSFGTKTPIEEIERVPPASFLTIDINTMETVTKKYWTPRFDPIDRPFKHVVEEFIQIFQKVMDERTDDDVQYGLMLSGGSDSRLLLEGLGPETTAFHLADWENREAQIAKQLSTTVGAEFCLLERDKEYQYRALEENPKLSNFSGWFDQAHASGFRNTIANESDVLFAGQFADTLFKGYAFPKRSIPLGKLGSLDLPIGKTITDKSDYIDHVASSEIPPYVDTDDTLLDIIERNLHKSTSSVDYHGVQYRDLQTLPYLDEIFPISNQTDFFWHESLFHMMPYRNPFLDNRLIQLYLTIPPNDQLRNNLINRAVEKTAPSLAA
ncbi:MAG: asparagine synthase-related protein, partial [Halobacteriaceae archaeon]